MGLLPSESTRPVVGNGTPFAAVVEYTFELALHDKVISGVAPPAKLSKVISSPRSYPRQCFD